MTDATTGAPETPQPETDSADLERRVTSGAHWFWWIAGLSVINSIAWWMEWSWMFIIGLGVTQFFDALGSAIGSWGVYAAIALDLAVVGGFVLIGWFAVKHQAAFIVGIVLFALGALLLLWAGDYMSVGFHAFALFFIVNGFLAMRRLAAESAPAALLAQAASGEQALAGAAGMSIASEADAGSGAE